MKLHLKQTNWVYFLSSLALVLLLLLIKQTTASKVQTRWHWGTAVSDKYLAPVFVHHASFILHDGKSVAADDLESPPEHPVSGKWSIGNGSIYSNFESLPEKIEADWLSLTERIWYKGTFDLPKAKLERIFRQGKSIRNLQFIIGLSKGGKVVFWIRGRNYREEIAVFTATPYQPDWQATPYASNESEAIFMETLYQRVPSVERRALEFKMRTAKKPKALKTIYSEVLEFVALEQNGDNDLLIARNPTDTITFICNFNKPVQLERGDRIRLQWKWDYVVDAGTAAAPELREFALDFKLLDHGQLSAMIQKGFSRLRASNSLAVISDYRKYIIEYNLKYYLANSTNLKIRGIVDEGTDLLYYSVSEKIINGQNAYELSLTPDQSAPQYIKKMYFLPEHPFNLLEYGDFF